MTKRRPLLLLVLSALLAGGSVAVAHPGHPEHSSGSKEMFEGEGVALDDQHGVTAGHLPPVSRGVRLVGKAEVTNPSGAGNDGRVADVSAYGDHAFLTAFPSRPACGPGRT